MEMVFRALIEETGEIIECDVFKTLYHASLSTAKLEVSDSVPCVLIRLERAFYSDYSYINKYGYEERDIIEREHIAYVAVSETGYTVDYSGNYLDVDRNAWKSVQRGVEV